MQKIIMKLTKIFGIVLSLHVGVILLVMFQPSCQTADKKKAPVPETADTSAETPLSGFNEGTGTIEEPKEEVFVAPTRPKPGEIIIPGNDITVPQPSLVDPITPVPLDPTPSPLRPTDVSIYKVVRGDTLWGIARKNSISLSALLGSNPALSKSSKLSIGQEIMIPSGNATAQPAPIIVPETSVNVGTSSGTYIVKAGDSLSRIARNNQVSLSALMKINGMNSSSIIRPGQTLLLPDSTASSSLTPSPVVVPSGATTHIVKKGENLTRISSLYGISIKQIMALNGLSDPGKIRVGQSLIVSGATQASANELQPPSLEKTESSVTEQEAGDTGDSLQNFFKGTTEDRPLIDAPDNP